MRFVLGLRSVACLPLVVLGSRILGVLRLGFETPCAWGEHEKVGHDWSKPVLDFPAA